MNDGRIVSNDGLDIAHRRLARRRFEEDQVAWSNALQARTKAGEVYLLGPSARVTLDADRLHPLAARRSTSLGPGRADPRNPFWSIAARAVELVHAMAEAIDIVDGYQPARTEPMTPWTSRAGRGRLGHRGPARAALPPLRDRRRRPHRGAPDRPAHVPEPGRHRGRPDRRSRRSVLASPQAEATHRLEQLIRSYDPCISCATHFLDLRVEATHDRLRAAPLVRCSSAAMRSGGTTGRPWLPPRRCCPTCRRFEHQARGPAPSGLCGPRTCSICPKGCAS